ncbi:riboflavin biosynthesis protein RibF [Ureaplasma urealyticum]|uniref:riboflavin biosynthesis protein RibF n=1 Tax=Ureaplasma urealyticum TaxID=2130 RepID=UPI00209C247A|nr:riboflavin biosynthesis protein RibF [Ureaplasma urealyticum]
MNKYMIIEITSTNIQQIRDQYFINELVIGFFDGIHLGHMSLLSNPENRSILTFKRIPRKTKNLFEFDERIQQLEDLGFKNIFVYDIFENNLIGTEFIEQILAPLSPNKIIVGANFTYGNDRCNAYSLKKYFNVEIKEITYNISTSRIKELIINKQIELANELLIKPYYRVGNVVYGNQIARSLGFNTANILCDNSLIDIAEGVYQAEVVFDNQKYDSVVYLGIPKTIHSRSYSMIEAHILNFSQDIYCKEIKIIFLKYLAPNLKFNSVNELTNAIKKYIKLILNKKKNNFGI